MTTSPVIFEWDGEHMVPLPRFHNLVNDQFVVGQTYKLAEVEDRSMRSHNHFFAAVKDGWMNLHEDYADRFPDPESLRKWALIKTGYRDERTIVASSKAEAQRIAAFTRPMDQHAVVVVREAVVIVWTAQSQAVRAMGRERFQQSKTAVLDEIAKMARVPPDQLTRNEAA